MVVLSPPPQKNFPRSIQILTVDLVKHPDVFFFEGHSKLVKNAGIAMDKQILHIRVVCKLFKAYDVRYSYFIIIQTVEEVFIKYL